MRVNVNSLVCAYISLSQGTTCRIRDITDQKEVHFTSRWITVYASIGSYMLHRGYKYWNQSKRLIELKVPVATSIWWIKHTIRSIYKDCRYIYIFTGEHLFELVYWSTWFVLCSPDRYTGSIFESHIHTSKSDLLLCFPISQSLPGCNDVVKSEVTVRQEW